MNFQEELIEALLTSPTEFNTFKRNNRKYMPYIHTFVKKLFPEEMVECEKKIVYEPRMNDESFSKEDLSFESINDLRLFVEKNTNYTYLDFLSEFSIKPGVENKLILNTNCNDKQHQWVYERLYRKLDTSLLNRITYTGSRDIDFRVIYMNPLWQPDIYCGNNMSMILRQLSRQHCGYIKHFELIIPSTHTMRDIFCLYLSYALLKILLFKETTKVISSKKRMTFGVEIEYYQKRHIIENKRSLLHGGIHRKTKQMLYKKQKYKYLLKKGILSYDVGWDGDCHSRLNENRIRLNGIKGLTGFYQIVEEMRKSANLTNESSIHVHLDHRYNNSYTHIIKNVNKECFGYHNRMIDNIFSYLSDSYEENEKNIPLIKLHKILQEYWGNGFLCNSELKNFINGIDIPLIWKEVLSFFGMNHFDFVSSLLLFLTNIKTCDEHHTVEYRMLTPTFDYSRIVAEMLIAVQINKAMLKGLPINEKIIRSIISAFNNSKVEIKA